MAGLLQIRQDQLDTERELDMQAQQQCAAILPVEAALEVGVEPTSHHDSEYLTTPYLDHLEPAHYDSGWSSEDSNSSIGDDYSHICRKI
ncbi:hypothetical protein SCLCIDRAFT_23137 [Scleroderma citrinum Foug A]|uniref:Uncharacterized protein n=1 Tax=Scleroderma citrinum Foug A TaxID=1036808 RepID=A0A0C3AJG4_9AGAM|nr:hypothetical protein SCLCIDRAFT_23137 [Scleroderma citrinum Foug A]